MNRNVFFFWILVSCMIASSCNRAEHKNSETNESSKPAVTDTLKKRKYIDPVLVSDSVLKAEAAYNERGDELFDDFLFNFVHDTLFQYQRTAFPLIEKLPNGKLKEIGISDLHNVLLFMDSDYTTTIYGNDTEMVFNEDTALMQASVEKIDLVNSLVTSYDFIKVAKRWNLKSIRNILFKDSELSDFLSFYSKFTTDLSFQNNALASSIHISMMDPEDDTQTIDGFITREQWSSMGNALPQGVITNIRYGKKYEVGNKVLMEKTSLGNGMSETFIFVKENNRWELVGYEN